MSDGKGNTASRRWTFTLYWVNHYNPVLHLRPILRNLPSGVRYIIFGRERCPTTNKRHLQGYLETTTPWRFKRVKTLLGSNSAHIEKARGTAAENVKYCSKAGDVESAGEPGKLKQGERTDLERIRIQIADGAEEKSIADEFFGKWCIYRRSFTEYRNMLRRTEDKTLHGVFLLWGKAGSGKTRFAYEWSKEQHGGVWLSSDPSLKWFDGYAAQECAILDDFRGDCPIQWMLRLLDRYPLEVQIKGGFTTWNPKWVFVTSNIPLQEWWPNTDEETVMAVKRRFTKIYGLDSLFQNWEERYEEIKTSLEVLL